MVFSKSLAARVRQSLAGRRDVVEKKMFGGVAFLLDGNMLVGVWQDSLIARLGAEQAEKALKQPNVGEFDITGRPMTGWVLIEPDGIDTDRQLGEWIEKAAQFVALDVHALPRK